MELQKLPDVPSVFVTHAAGDTREMERRLRTEVECKKEELRQMVGRRYRDIIEAADNIKQMKLCSDEVSQNLRTVQRGFEELQCLQNRMMGSYGNSTIAEVHWSVANNNNEVTAKLKLLMALSEQVYNYFDNGQMFHAVVLLKFCQHLNETLVAHPPDSVFLSSSKKLLDRLRTRLIKLCTNMLAEYNASNSHEAYEELEASFMLLENLSATGFLARFLELRKRSFELLCQDIACSSKDKICGAVWLIVQTMMVGLNVNMEKIAKLSAAASGPVNVMFKGLLEKFTTLYGVLPMSMFGRCFKILTAGIPIADTHDTSLTQQCRTWCSWATEALKLQMTSTLSFCDSLESVISLRSSCSDQLDKMVSDILKSFPDWHLEVERGFKSRIQVILERKVKDKRKKFQKILEKHAELTAAQVLQIFDDVIVNVNENIAKWSQHSACCSYFLWSADCNNSSRQAADIELKVKGCNTSIYSFVDSFNSRLNSVRHQLETYVNVVYGTLDCNTSDAKEIWTSLSDASCAGIQMLVSAIHQQFDTISKNCSDAHEAAERILYCSKLCVALCDLCPQLKLCLGAQKALPQQSCGNWTLSKNILTACGTSGYRMWAKSVAALAMCHVFSGQVESSEFLSCEEQVTEILSVDEDCGDGQRLTSQFLLPIQCSVPIQTWLTEVSGFVCDAGAHSLPDACLVMLLLEILKCYLQYCVTAALKLSSETSRRKLAFQLVFDVRVLINLLSWTPTGSEEQLEHSRLVLESKSLLVSIESFLDPFDFEVVSPYLRQYIERFTTKFVNTYGCILPTALQAVLLRPSSAKRSAEGTQPYVPEVASQCNLFHVIAVPGMPDIKKEAKGSRKIDLFLPQSPKNQQSSRLSVASTMLQKSSSFYSGWFG